MVAILLTIFTASWSCYFWLRWRRHWQMADYGLAVAFGVITGAFIVIPVIHFTWGDPWNVLSAALIAGCNLTAVRRMLARI